MDGPKRFYVQLRQNKELLKFLEDSIKNFSVESLGARLPVPGKSYIAKCPKSNKLFRASALNVSETQCKIRYTDYGETDVISNKDIFYLPMSVSKVEALSIL